MSQGEPTEHSFFPAREETLAKLLQFFRKHRIQPDLKGSAQRVIDAVQSGNLQREDVKEYEGLLLDLFTAESGVGVQYDNQENQIIADELEILSKAGYSVYGA